MTTSKFILQNQRLKIGAPRRVREFCGVTCDAGKVRHSVGTLLILLLMSKSALAFDLGGTAWAKIAREEGIDPLMLYAIALTEAAGRRSGARSSHGPGRSTSRAIPFSPHPGRKPAGFWQLTATSPSMSACSR